MFSAQLAARGRVYGRWPPRVSCRHQGADEVLSCGDSAQSTEILPGCVDFLRQTLDRCRDWGL